MPPPSISLASFNCFGTCQSFVGWLQGWRPPVAKRLRHSGFRRLIAQHTVFCVQELFTPYAQRAFVEHVRAEGMSMVSAYDRDWNHGPSLCGTGLAVAFRGERVAAAELRFQEWGTGWDKAAQKGCLWLHLRVDSGQEIGVLTTHVQAGKEPADMVARQNQLQEMADWLQQQRPRGLPTFVAGDLNVDALGAEKELEDYQKLTALLPGYSDLGLQADLPTYEPLPDENSLAYAHEPDGHCQRIDHIWYHPGEQCWQASEVEVVRVDQLESAPELGPLSDHWAVRTRLELP